MIRRISQQEFLPPPKGKIQIGYPLLKGFVIPLEHYMVINYFDNKLQQWAIIQIHYCKHFVYAMVDHLETYILLKTHS